MFFEIGKGLGLFRHIPRDLPNFEQIALEEGARALCELNRGLVFGDGTYRIRKVHDIGGHDQLY